MAEVTSNIRLDGSEMARNLYRQIAFMGVSALILSVAIIVYFNQTVFTPMSEAQHTLELASNTFLPYMLSALVAAITSIAIILILPMARGAKSTGIVQQRLAAMSSGDLSSKIYLGPEHEQIRGIVGELNNTISSLGDNIAQWKVINRNQWDLLQSVRTAAERQDIDLALKHVAELESNWEKIAEIEERLTTG